MKKRLLKWFVIIDMVVLALIVFGYLLVTSDYFIKSQVIPRVSKAIDAPLSVETTDVSPLSSRVSFTGLTLGDSSRPFLTIERFDCSYGMWDIFFGEITVDSLKVSKVTVKARRGDGGVWELPFRTNSDQRRSGEEDDEKGATPGEAGKPPRLNISNVEISDLNVFVEIDKGEELDPTTLAFRDVNLKLPSLKTGNAATLRLEGRLEVEADEAIDVKEGVVSLTAKATLSETLNVAAAELEFILSGLSGSVHSFDLAKNQFKLKAAVTEKEGLYTIKELTLKQTIDHQSGTAISVDGVVSPDPKRVDVNVSVKPLTPELLNFVGGLLGDYQFGRTMVEFNGKLTATPASGLASKGHVAIRDFTVQSSRRRLPTMSPLNVKADYAFSFDPSKKRLEVDAFDVNVVNTDRRVMEIALKRPARCSFSDAGLAFGDSSPEVKFTIDNLDLAELAPLISAFTGAEFSKGRLNCGVTGGVAAEDGAFTLKGEVDASGLTFKYGNARFKEARARQRLTARLESLSDLVVDVSETRLLQGDDPAFELKGSGRYDLSERKGSGELIATLHPASAAALLPPTWLEIPGIGSTLRAASPGKTTLRLAGSGDAKAKEGELSSFALKIAKSNGGALTLSLRKPFSGSWADGVASLKKGTFKTTLEVHSMETTLINTFLLESSPFSFSDGRVYARLDVDIGKLSRWLKIKGFLNGLDLKFVVGEMTFGEMSMKNDVEFTLEDYLTLAVKEWKASFEHDGKSIMALGLDGDLVFDSLDGKAALSIDHFDQRAFALMGVDSPVKTLTLTGMLKTAFKGPGGVGLEGNLTARDIRLKPKDPSSLGEIEREAKPVLSGNLTIDVEKNASGVKIDDLVAELSDGDAKLINLAATGFLFTPTTSGKSSLKLTSKGADVKRLQAVFSRNAAPRIDAGPGDENDQRESTAPSAPKEPPPNNLGGMRLNVALDLNNIVYGEHLTIDCDGRTRIDGGRVDLSPMTLSVNGSPVNIGGFVDLSVADGYPYSLECDLTDFSLRGLLREFTKTLNDDNHRGEISNLSVKMNGKGITPRNVSRNLRGTAKVEFSNLSAPIQSLRNPYVQILFIPLRVLANIQTFLPSLSLSKDLAKAREVSQAILDNTRNVNFDKGVLVAAVDKGRLNLKKCELSSGDVIRELSARGDIVLVPSNKIELEMRMNAMGVIIPLTIRGTAKKPKPDIKAFIIDFAQINALNILDPRNLERIVNGLKDGGGGLTGALIEILSKGAEEGEADMPKHPPKPKDEPRQEEDASKDGDDKSGFPAEKLLDTIDGFLK